LDIKNFLKELDDNNIKFKNHFHERTHQRPIDKELVIKYIKTDLIQSEEQPARKVGEKKYKLQFRMSRKYSLIVIAAVEGKSLNIITAWNTDRKWQKANQK
jgi:hypothetical protein